MILMVSLGKPGGLTRKSRARARPSGEAALTDRELLLRIGRALTAGDVELKEVARAIEVSEPALAVALERLFGVVPAPPPRSV